jgi:hypothetical protein
LCAYIGNQDKTSTYDFTHAIVLLCVPYSEEEEELCPKLSKMAKDLLPKATSDLTTWIEGRRSDIVNIWEEFGERENDFDVLSSGGWIQSNPVIHCRIDRG